MANKVDLSIDYLGVKCENPFFLSSSPVGGCYDMVAKAYEAGWGAFSSKQSEDLSQMNALRDLTIIQKINTLDRI